MAKQSNDDKPWLYKPGQSGNPAGRPKGSRNKLAESFIQALYDDFMANGPAAIIACRATKPEVYLKVIASIIPREFHVKDASLGDMTDEELVSILEAVRAMQARPPKQHQNGGRPN